MTEAVFRLQDVGYAYADGTVALERVDLEIRRGEAVALLGANGSGKSTLLRLLAALDVPTRGRLEAFGEPVTARRIRDPGWNARFRRRVGLVFQDAEVQLFLPTVGDEVRFGPAQLGLPEAEVAARAVRALERMDVVGLVPRSPHRLSVGERKRVAIATVLSLDPEVWLLDEPTGGLDPRTHGAVVDLLLELAARGRTLVVATHDLEIADVVARRAVVLGEDHRVLADRPAAEVLDDGSLLLRANLVHRHRHRHGREEHAHPHRHWRADGHGHG